MRAIALLTVFCLAGCISPEQMAANQRAEEARQQQASMAYRESLFNQCRSIGYTDNTDQFRQCVLQLHAVNQQRNSAVLGAIVGAAANAQAQEEAARRYQALPICGTFGALASYQRSQGQCR